VILSGERAEDKMNNANNRLDRSTYSNPTEVLSTVIHLEWNLNFETNIISGSVTHSMVVVAHHGAVSAKFDSSSGLTVTSVEVNSHPVQYSVGESSDALGKCLVVPLPDHLKSVGDEFDIKFNYSTSPNASAAQWLSAKATKSGNHVSPLYLRIRSFSVPAFLVHTMPSNSCTKLISLPRFSRCQDHVHCCCQVCTLAARHLLTQLSRAPSWARVLMSALDETPNDAPKGETHWRQPVPTPAYLGPLLTSHS
jgi:hypothetical protein